MEYDNPSDRQYAKSDHGKYKTGIRFEGDRNYSALEVTTEAGKATNERGQITAGTEVGAHALNVAADGKNYDAKFLGATFGAKYGEDSENYLGAEAKAKLTAAEIKTDVADIHVGLGVSTGAKVEDGTAEVKLAGCGLKVGKKIGVSVFDNEVSVDPLALVGKGWLWK